MHFLEDLEMEYEHHPRLFWIGLLVLMGLFFAVQSYIAQPRPLATVIYDLWEVLAILCSLIFIFWNKKIRNLLIFGIIYLVLAILMWFGFFHYIKAPYGTFFFLCGLWFLGDWFNMKIFHKSVFSELIRGNYYLAFGVILSTLLLGAVTEIANLPFRAWWYNWPFPSIEIMGLPIIMVVCGWLPWVFAIFIFFYPYALQKPKKFK